MSVHLRKYYKNIHDCDTHAGTIVVWIDVFVYFEIITVTYRTYVVQRDWINYYNPKITNNNYNHNNYPANKILT